MAEISRKKNINFSDFHVIINETSEATFSSYYPRSNSESKTKQAHITSTHGNSSKEDNRQTKHIINTTHSKWHINH